MRPLVPLLLSVFLVGCAPLIAKPAQTPGLDFRTSAPDVIIIAMSGRCSQPCRAPRDNYDYLASRGSVDALADVFQKRGLTVAATSYADSSLDTFQPLKVTAEQRGFARLLTDFARIKSEWLGKPHPPHLILFGHSHGSAWLHHLAALYPDVPFDLQIDLDGICASWQLDHGATLAQQPIDVPGKPRAIDACKMVQVGSHYVYPKDIVLPNVAYDLEVQSKRLPNRASASGGYYFNYLFDVIPNVRPDGSRRGIETFISTREDHSAVTYPNSDAMKWVLERTQDITRDWKHPGFY